MCRYIDARECLGDLQITVTKVVYGAPSSQKFSVLILNALDHHLVSDAILTTGRMAKRLSRVTYYALVQKYLTLSERKDKSERIYICTFGQFPFSYVRSPIVEGIDGQGDVNIRLLLEKHEPDTENHTPFLLVLSQLQNTFCHLPPTLLLFMLRMDTMLCHFHAWIAALMASLMSLQK